MASMIDNRAKLASRLPVGSITLIPSAELKYRNNDVEYPFRQESNFWWLTGLNEPDAIIALEKNEQGIKATLFSQARDPSAEIWTGKIVGQDSAVADLEFDEAFPIAKADDQIPTMLLGKKIIYCPFGDETFNNKLDGWLDSAKGLAAMARRTDSTGITPKLPTTKKDATSKVRACRLVKSPEEIASIRRACQVSAQAHTMLMQQVKAGNSEAGLQALFDGECIRNGAKANAYPSIVGGGKNACCLHYTENDKVLNNGDLVLVDAGCEIEFYAADITRTFPINGKYTPEQRALYDIVLSAQLAGIEACKPGSNIHAVEKAASMALIEGLLKLGLLEGDPETLFQSGAHNEFYPHSIGHWVGLDVHDPSKYANTKGWIPFEPNMVLTVEPGLYIQPDNERVASKWRGIGIRIEDVIQITADGCDVLSDGVVKRAEDIERLMGKVVKSQASQTAQTHISNGYNLQRRRDPENQSSHGYNLRPRRHPENQSSDQGRTHGIRYSK